MKAEIASQYDDEYQTRILVRGRNEWNGDVGTLHYFVKPGDRDVLEFSRNAIHDKKSHFDSMTSEMMNLEKARAIFDALSKTVRYVSDPKLSRDFTP